MNYLRMSQWIMIDFFMPYVILCIYLEIASDEMIRFPRS